MSTSGILRPSISPEDLANFSRRKMKIRGGVPGTGRAPPPRETCYNEAGCHDTVVRVRSGTLSLLRGAATLGRNEEVPVEPLHPSLE